MSGMGCIAAVALADHAKGRGSDGERARVARHLEGCADCRTALARISGAQATLAALLDGPAPGLSPLGAARVEAALRWSGRQAPVRDERRWARLVAVSVVPLAAAMVGVIALHGWMVHRQQGLGAVEPRTVAVVAPPAAPSPTTLTALVTLLGGEVTLRRGALGPAPLDVATELRAGDRLTTAATGRVAFQWGEGSAALLSPSSELCLARLDVHAQELGLDGGKVSVRVGPHQPGESLRVLTPGHVVSVHGTWFTVAAEAHGTAVEVIEGVIEVAARDGASATTRLAAPSRAFFPYGPASAKGLGAGVPSEERSLAAKEAAALRAASEMGLLAWPTGALPGHLADGWGLLRVATDPAGSLAVDGVAFGAAPLALRRPRGRHLVELSRPGYATVSQWITVGDEPGELRTALLPEAPAHPALPKVTVAPEPDEVQDVVRAHERHVSACYERALKRDPQLAGSVTLTLRVGDGGKVAGTSVEEDTLAGAPAVAECLRREAQTWTFGHARNALVVYPFVFRTP